MPTLCSEIHRFPWATSRQTTHRLCEGQHNEAFDKHSLLCQHVVLGEPLLRHMRYAYAYAYVLTYDTELFAETNVLQGAAQNYWTMAFSWRSVSFNFASRSLAGVQQMS